MVYVQVLIIVLVKLVGLEQIVQLVLIYYIFFEIITFFVYLAVCSKCIGGSCISPNNCLCPQGTITIGTAPNIQCVPRNFFILFLKK